MTLYKDLEQFYEELENHRKPNPSGDRVTHCYLLHTLDNVEHKIEVRNWGPIESNVLSISIVSWTLCAGTGVLELTEDSANKFEIIGREAISNIALSDTDFDTIMSHENDEPNEALINLMKEETT